MPQIFKRGRAASWTLERVARLTVQEIKRLRENAERLNEPAIVAHCDQALKDAQRALRKASLSASADR